MGVQGRDERPRSGVRRRHGGEGGIRTHGAAHRFSSGTINHSDTSPRERIPAGPPEPAFRKSCRRLQAGGRGRVDLLDLVAPDAADQIRRCMPLCSVSWTTVRPRPFAVRDGVDEPPRHRTRAAPRHTSGRAPSCRRSSRRGGEPDRPCGPPRAAFDDHRVRRRVVRLADHLGRARPSPRRAPRPRRGAARHARRRIWLLRQRLAHVQLVVHCAGSRTRGGCHSTEMAPIRRIGILTGGGDVPGLNSVIKSVTYRSTELGMEVIGIRRGWEASPTSGPATSSTPTTSGRSTAPTPGRSTGPAGRCSAHPRTTPPG